MKLCVSNIAWSADEESAVAGLMVRHGFSGVEVAPGRVGARPAELDDGTIRRYREFWNSRGIGVVAMQALLFGRSDLTVFGPETARRSTTEYLRRLIRMGALLGAGVLVFGAPRNRRVGGLPVSAADAIAIPFFRELGNFAADHGVTLCIEPNPASYGADWILNAVEASAFVRRVASAGFGLHLDAGALHLANEGAEVVQRAGSPIRHFHASEPELAPPCGGSPVPHLAYARALASVKYENWVSVEMRRIEGAASGVGVVEDAMRYVRTVYGAVYDR